MARVLIIDDDPQVLETIESLVLRQGYECHLAGSLKDGLKTLERLDIDLVFLDVRLPDGNGLDALGQIRGRNYPPDVIVLTGQGDPEGAELAIQGGVWDYLVKPSPIKQIKDTLNRAMAYRRERKLSEKTMSLDLSDVVGESSAMRQCYERIGQASGSDSTVLVTGETGTGKEMMARTIHRNSARAGRAFVVVDCAALTESLLESILFGHTKGAFTGAARDRVGLVKLADQGTLFLDEIGELPLTAQKAFLRVLQERRFRPVGSSLEQESDFRLISATNRDLAAMVRAGEFRQDLFYRINTIHIVLPPLREREQDIIALARHHIDKLCRQRNIANKSLDPELEEMLKQYDWPGNVRELFNTVEQAFVLSGAERTIYTQHLPHAVRIRVTKSILGLAKGAEGGGSFEDDEHGETELIPTLKDYKSSMELGYLRKIVAAHGKDIQKMISVSGLSRSHLYAMLKKHGIDL
jgi:two-component system NtrC family response regulator